MYYPMENLHLLAFFQIHLHKGDHTWLRFLKSKMKGFKIVLMNKGDELLFHLDNPPPEFTYFLQVTSEAGTKFSYVKMTMISKKDETREEFCDTSTNKLIQKGD